ncbi:MAG: serine/threonine-protein kinase [Acidobacteriota bacterium]
MKQCCNPECRGVAIDERNRCLGCGLIATDTIIKRRYRVESLLNRSSAGASYLIVDSDCFDERFVLKEFLALAHNTSSAAIRFGQQVRTLCKLRHNGIPTLHAYFVLDERHYLVQEYIDGVSLADEMTRRNGPLEEFEVRMFLIGMLDILRYLHSQQPPVIHRDIKPSNIMKRRDGQYILLDFGIIREAAEATPQTSSEPTSQSDLYALGIAAVELLTAATATKLVNPTTGELNWRDVLSLHPSPAIEAVLEGLTHHDIDQRFPSAEYAYAKLVDLIAPSPTGSLVEELERRIKVKSELENQASATIDTNEENIPWLEDIEPLDGQNEAGCDYLVELPCQERIAPNKDCKE